jgi:hypothetical protein
MFRPVKLVYDINIGGKITRNDIMDTRGEEVSGENPF